MTDLLAHYTHTTNAHALALEHHATTIRRLAHARITLAQSLTTTDTQPGDEVRAYYVAVREESEAYASAKVAAFAVQGAEVALMMGLEVRHD